MGLEGYLDAGQGYSFVDRNLDSGRLIERGRALLNGAQSYAGRAANQFADVGKFILDCIKRAYRSLASGDYSKDKSESQKYAEKMPPVPTNTSPAYASISAILNPVPARGYSG